MNEYQREEDAFRSAFQAAASRPAPDSVRSRRVRWITPVLAAAVVSVAVGGTVLVLDQQDSRQDRPTDAGPSTEQRGWRWIGIRDVEVKAPIDWAPQFETGRPDCIQIGTDDPINPSYVPKDLPRRGYVVIGDPQLWVTLQGCFRDKAPGDPPPEFGELPFPLWQPYVKVELARPDLAEQRAEYRDTHQNFRGWNLTRQTEHGVQISVLSAPGNEQLNDIVLGSVRQVETNSIGCPARSTVLAMNIRTDLDANPLPKPADVATVAICDYVRQSGSGWLRGSRELDADAAKDLVANILTSPTGSGPNSPGTCLTSRPTKRALLLRVSTKAATEPSSDAYVFFDSCEGNGILEPQGSHALTEKTCPPMFAEPPIIFGAGNANIFSICNHLVRQ